tara:strand:- start:1116 stop:2156 length:1041 start_codon:yes stop_codon:yes gene_type:complete
MELDQNTLLLFSPFHRNVGNPYQYEIHTQKNLEDFIIRNNGINDCSASVYSQDSTIDKIWFDFDGIGALDEARTLYKFLRDINCKVLPIISGRKGIHLHLILSSNTKVNSEIAKEVLMDLIILIISNGLGLRDWKQKTTLDWSKLGATTCTCRIPNTLRPPANTTWCSYLPEDWDKLSDGDVWDYSKSPHSFDYSGKIYSIDELSSNLSKLPTQTFTGRRSSFQNESRFEKQPEFEPSLFFKDMSLPDLLKALEKIMRPCLFRHITSSKPRNDARVATVLDLLAAGLLPKEILAIFSKLNWDKYDEQLTSSKVMYIAERFYGDQDLSPYSCARLRQINLPKVCCVE